MSRIILEAAPDKKINKQYLKISLKSFLKFRLSFGLLTKKE
jgi:hypothetical protein